MLDDASLILRRSLSGLAERQRLIANNLANMETPGYRARDVSFEQVLASEIGGTKDLTLVSTSPGHMTASSQPNARFPVLQRNAVFGKDENGVDVDAEMARLSETVIEYNAASQLLASRLSLLRSAITEGRR